MRRALVLAMSATLVVTTSAIAAVQTDKWLYDHGETVQITGDGMAPGEDVRIDVYFPPEVEGELGDLAQSNVVTADENGNFADTFFLDYWMPAGIYDVIATGLSSGTVFTTQFDPINSVSSPAVFEGTGGGTTAMVFQVNVTGSAATYYYRTNGGTATSGAACTAGVDYIAVPSASATWSNSTPTSQTQVVVQICPDGDPEADETIVVQVANNPGYLTTGNNQVTSGTGTIRNDDNALSIAPSSVVEGTGSGTTTMQFEISLAPAAVTGQQIQVAWATQAITGQANGANNCNAPTNDFVNASGTVTFVAGESTKTVGVTVCRDGTVESNETFQVVIALAAASPTSALITTAEAIGTIIDDDGVAPNTPPTLNLPGDITAEATSASGAVVIYSASASDAEDGAIAATCVPASGSTFAIGPTTVNCSATDSAGATTNGSFTVTVVDTTEPVVAISSTAAKDGTTGWYNIDSSGTSGIQVDVVVTDAVGATSLVCTNIGNPIAGPLDPSGASFMLYDGQHSIECTATDAGGNTGDDSADFDVDQTAPTITAALDRLPAATGWFNIATGAPVVEFTCSDALSGIATCPADHTFGEGENQSHTGTAYDNAGNSASDGVSDVDVDLTAPTISADLDRAAAGTGWFNIATGAPVVEFTCSDALSGIASCPADHTFGEGENQSHTGTAYDNAGNSATDGVTDVDVDLTAPGLTWNSLIEDGDEFYFGSVPAAPTCSASDALSGPDGCAVTGYGTTVGAKTLTATANDVAGNETVETRGYTVLAWTMSGFYRPVDMGGMWNIVKGGSTVPLKFEIFAGSTELTTTSAVKSFTVKAVACPLGGFLAEEVDFTTTGGTSLRYDGGEGRFINNWQTPKKAGACYQVTMEAQDGSTIVANFKLK